MIEIISYLTVGTALFLFGGWCERRFFRSGNLLLSLQAEEIKANAEQRQRWMEDRRKMKELIRDIGSIYAQIPMLPVSPETVEAATDVLTQFCITFHEQIDIANQGPSPKALEFRRVDGTVKVVHVATGKEWQPGPA